MPAARALLPRQHSCRYRTLCGVGFFVFPQSSDGLWFFSFRTRRSPSPAEQQLRWASGAWADLNNPSVGVNASPGGVVVSGRLTRRATLTRNGSRAIRRWPGLDAGVGRAGLAVEPQCDSSVYGPHAAGDATTIPVILPGHPCLPIAVPCIIPYSRLGGQWPWFRHGGRSDAQQAFDTVSHRLASHC